MASASSTSLLYGVERPWYETPSATRIVTINASVTGCEKGSRRQALCIRRPSSSDRNPTPPASAAQDGVDDEPAAHQRAEHVAARDQHDRNDHVRQELVVEQQLLRVEDLLPQPAGADHPQDRRRANVVLPAVQH